MKWAKNILSSRKANAAQSCEKDSAEPLESSGEISSPGIPINLDNQEHITQEELDVSTLTSSTHWKEKTIESSASNTKLNAIIFLLSLQFILYAFPYALSVYEFLKNHSIQTNISTQQKNKDKAGTTKNLTLDSTENIELNSAKTIAKIIVSEGSRDKSGTGFIFERSQLSKDKYRYYLLTTKHTFDTFDLSKDKTSLTIVTPKEKCKGQIVSPSSKEWGKDHQERLSKYDIEFIKGKDLQIVFCNSIHEYSTVTISEHTPIKVWDSIYMRGYPCPTTGGCSDKNQSQFMQSRIGEMHLLPAGSTLVGGYSIPYIDGVNPGTSGSPVINGYGEVIAVNGRDRRAEGTDEFYRLSDGTRIDEPTRNRMEFFSWGVDIRKFKKK
jgi:hypothetical protein